MIHDATAEVTCDGFGCGESVHVRLEFVYSGTMHAHGHYDHSDKHIEKRLAADHDWIVKDNGHFCSEACAEEPAI